ncbi:RteC domain-containing protein [Chryseobacterium profundimaris]|uniref:RteC domain-containing protein n=1 Tax=Chryseobacterium profundimaris TaxID=1387275 RepID=UPI003D2A94BE
MNLTKRLLIPSKLIIYYEADLSFTTSHDFKVAKILANDLLQLYLEDQLKLLDVKIQKLQLRKFQLQNYLGQALK